MDEDLLNMWNEINKDHFDGALKPLSAISWETLSGPGGIGAHGRFFPQSRVIVIDELFKFDKELMRANDAAELGKFSAAYGVLLHEMVHQALYQRNAPRPGGHGEAFLAEAQRIATRADARLPTAEDVHHWPLFDEAVDEPSPDEPTRTEG